MRLFHCERVSIGNTIFRRHMTPQQKDRLATVNALFSGILLTSDMPTRYTPPSSASVTPLCVAWTTTQKKYTCGRG